MGGLAAIQVSVRVGPMMATTLSDSVNFFTMSAALPRSERAGIVVESATHGIPARAARAIYEEVEAATLGGWRDAAAHAGVPAKIAGIWEKEMMKQTKLLRDDAHRLATANKARPPGRKRSPND